jgi:hypothetical protein
MRDGRHHANESLSKTLSRVSTAYFNRLLIQKRS